MPERVTPRAAAELVDASFALYRQNLGLLTAIAAVVYVPVAVASVLLHRATGDVTSFAIEVPPPALSPTAATVVSFVLSSFGAFIVQAALSVAVTDKYLGLPVTFGTAYGAVLRRAHHLVAAFALSAAAVTAGSCACVLPGVVVAVGLAFAPSIVILEKLSAPRALTRAWHLSRGDRFRVLGVVLLASVATASIGATASLCANWLFRSDLAIELCTQLIGRLALPVTQVVLVVVYFDNRVRKEGFDLALLAARIATSAPAAKEPAATFSP
jgi:hypothetical protein